MKLTATIELINRITRGWTAYFRLSWDKSIFRTLDGWIRRHIRDIKWRQWKTPRTRYRKLLELGLPHAQARGAYNRRGPWAMAKSPQMNRALSNAAVSGMGLVSLSQEHKRLACTL